MALNVHPISTTEREPRCHSGVLRWRTMGVRDRPAGRVVAVSRHRTAAAALALCLTFAIACDGEGGDSVESRSTGSDAEDHIGEAMLLTLADFQVGWTEQIASDTEGDSPFEHCPAQAREGRTGYAATGSFSPDIYPTFSHWVLLYEARPPTTAFETWESRLRCMVETLNSGAVDNDDVKYSNARLGRTSLTFSGYRTGSHRLSVSVQSKTRSGPGTSATVYYEYAIVEVDRSLIWIGSKTIRSPLDPDDLRRLSEIAVPRAEVELRTQEAR